MSKRIPGIPTTYKGIRFRSRLEARWAVFFDLMGWRWDYEPFDTNGWIPDFALTTRRTILVEVKPIDWRAEFSWDDGFDVQQKMIGGVAGTPLAENPLLLLGAFLHETHAPGIGACVALGELSEHWTAERSGTAGDIGHVFQICALGLSLATGAPDFAHVYSQRHDPRYGPYRHPAGAAADGFWPAPLGWPLFAGAWAEAGNTVQWKSQGK